LLVGFCLLVVAPKSTFKKRGGRGETIPSWKTFQQKATISKQGIAMGGATSEE